MFAGGIVDPAKEEGLGLGVRCGKFRGYIVIVLLAWI